MTQRTYSGPPLGRKYPSLPVSMYELLTQSEPDLYWLPVDHHLATLYSDNVAPDER